MANLYLTLNLVFLHADKPVIIDSLIEVRVTEFTNAAGYKSIREVVVFAASGAEVYINPENLLILTVDPPYTGTNMAVARNSYGTVYRVEEDSTAK